MASVDVDELVDWDSFADDYEALMRKYYPQLLELAYGDAADLVGDSRDGGTLTFDLNNPAIKRTIDMLATKVRDVADTTKDEIRSLVDQQTEEGWSMDELARQIRSHGDDMSKSRSLTIARTESGTAYNLGGLLSYADAGVKKVQVLDGDKDEECAAADGATWSLDDAQANPLGHPNCTRAFSPVVDW
jgi:uncharacterized protein with gpF-like domain